MNDSQTFFTIIYCKKLMIFLIQIFQKIIYYEEIVGLEMFKLMDKKIFTILRSNFLFIWT